MKPTTAQQIKSELPFYFMMACAFLIPLHKVIVPWLIGLWTLSSFFTYNWKSNFKAFYKNKTAWIFPIIYLLAIISLLYTKNIAQGMFKLEVKLSFLLLPILMLPAINFNIQKRFKVLLSFAAGNVLAVLICIGVASINYFDIGISAFYYNKLSVFHHTSYAAMYLSFAISILYISYMRPKVFPVAKWSFFPVFFVFLIIIYLLSSKSGLISVVGLIIVFMGISLKKSFSWSNVVFALIIIGASIFIVLQNKRFTGTSKKVTTEINPTTTESTTARILVWETAFELISENVLIGTSPGDANDELINQYHKNGYTGAEKLKLNTHNQFLQTFLNYGILGIILLVAAFLLPIIVNSKNNIILLFFLGITGFNFLFESILETQSGIIFFIFFFSLLNYTNKYSANDSFFTAKN